MKKYKFKNNEGITQEFTDSKTKLTMEHYYLLNGTVNKGGEMPNITNPNNDSLIYGDTYIRRWLSSLQPCEISENEFYKIHDYLIENIPFKNSDISNPIDITDIVKEKDGKIYFKQPTEKQVESECETNVFGLGEVAEHKTSLVVQMFKLR